MTSPEEAGSAAVRSTPRRRLLVLAAAVVLLGSGVWLVLARGDDGGSTGAGSSPSSGGPTAQASPEPDPSLAPVVRAEQPHRPLVHFSPARNWMNDPNGLVYLDGVFHLFFQHNPYGTGWGNMSWGHATSTDLVTWQEQPVAIEQGRDGAGTVIEDVFSGSVVVDEDDTAGFRTSPDDPAPLVAIYTSAFTAAHPQYAGIQAQSLAYSLDGGSTWTRYEGNPVLDRGSSDFRDPKVFRYEGEAGSYWVMVAVEAREHTVVLYRSDDLITWQHLSDFGPANAVTGIWECPDLFELPVDGDPTDTRWVLVVSLNPGAVGGGSGTQYFVGDFDGTTFTSSSTVAADPLPEGEVLADFEDGYGDWVVSNEPGNRFDGPFGSAPATGALPDQEPVSGFVGSALVNGYLDRDWAIGSLESPSFTLSAPYLSFLVGGGAHPRVPGSQLGNEPPTGRVLFDFEPGAGTLQDRGWTVEGDFAVEPRRNPATTGGEEALGAGWINTWEGGPRGDDNVGMMTSSEFTIDGDHLSFLIGGGRRDDGTLQAELLVAGEVVRTATGRNQGPLQWTGWDVTEYAGATARLRIRDEANEASGGWAHLTLDHVVLGDEPARVRSEETSVNLVVDGEVVRSATGSDSEVLDWVSWDVSELLGSQAQLLVVDNSRTGWGHIMLDQVVLTADRVPSRLERYDWLDHGRDYYAAVSYAGVADESVRIMQGWMSNWQYAEAVPTLGWRGAMALPRTVSLVSTPRGPRLAQAVATQVLEQIDGAAAETLTDVALVDAGSADGETVDGVLPGGALPGGVLPGGALPGGVELGLSGSLVRIEVVLDPGTATRAGIRVFGGPAGTAPGGTGSTVAVGTLIGYDAVRGQVFVDRRASGDVAFSSSFPSISYAPVSSVSENADGTVTFEVYLDRAAVELYVDGGLATITSQVFPPEGADRIDAFVEGGSAVLRSITVTPLVATMS